MGTPRGSIPGVTCGILSLGDTLRPPRLHPGGFWAGGHHGTVCSGCVPPNCPRVWGQSGTSLPCVPNPALCPKPRVPNPLPRVLSPLPVSHPLRWFQGCPSAHPVVGAGSLGLGQDFPISGHQHHLGVSAPAAERWGGHCQRPPLFPHPIPDHPLIPSLSSSLWGHSGGPEWGMLTPPCRAGQEGSRGSSRWRGARTDPPEPAAVPPNRLLPPRNRLLSPRTGSCPPGMGAPEPGSGIGGVVPVSGAAPRGWGAPRAPRALTPPRRRTATPSPPPLAPPPALTTPTAIYS